MYMWCCCVPTTFKAASSSEVLALTTHLSLLDVMQSIAALLRTACDLQDTKLSRCRTFTDLRIIPCHAGDRGTALLGIRLANLQNI